MNFSRLLPFLPLLLLTAGAPIPSATMNQSNSRLNPSDLCPLVQIVEHELCGNAKNFTDLCVLLQNYNASFCSNAAEPLSNNVLSLEKEFIKEHHNIHDLCPILNFIDEELCASRAHVGFQFYPKQLCPLLNITYTELCS